MCVLNVSAWGWSKREFISGFYNGFLCVSSCVEEDVVPTGCSTLEYLCNKDDECMVSAMQISSIKADYVKAIHTYIYTQIHIKPLQLLKSEDDLCYVRFLGV